MHAALHAPLSTTNIVSCLPLRAHTMGRRRKQAGINAGARRVALRSDMDELARGRGQRLRCRHRGIGAGAHSGAAPPNPAPPAVRPVIQARRRRWRRRCWQRAGSGARRWPGSATSAMATCRGGGSGGGHAHPGRCSSLRRGAAPRVVCFSRCRSARKLLDAARAAPGRLGAAAQGHPAFSIHNRASNYSLADTLACIPAR